MDSEKFTKLEIKIMKILTRNSGKMLSQYYIYNELMEEYDLKDPKEKEDLKMDMVIVIRYLPSSFDGVIARKDEKDCWTVGFKYEKKDNNSDELSSNDFKDVDETSPLKKEGMPLEKSVVNWIVDNNIDYGLTKEDLKGNTILHYLVLYNDLERIKIVLNHNTKLSFFNENQDKIAPIDLVKDIAIYSYIMKNFRKEMNQVLSEIITAHNKNNKELEKAFQDKNNEIHRLRTGLAGLSFIVFIVCILEFIRHIF